MCNELLLKADYVKYHDPSSDETGTDKQLARVLGSPVAGRLVLVFKNTDRFHLWLRQLKTYFRNSIRHERLSGITHFTSIIFYKSQLHNIFRIIS